MRKISVADSETDPFKFGRIPAPFLWGYYDGSTYEEFETTVAFVEFMAQRDEICYVHNGGKFDFFFMADFIGQLEPIQVINGRLVKFKIGACEFRDSWPIMPVALAKLGGKKGIDYALMESDVRAKHMREIRDYLYADCIALYNAVCRYIETFGLHLTVAGTAMKKWSAMTDQDPPKTSHAFYDQFAQYYYGGRVECFQKGVIETPFTICDINSAYPFAMTHRHAYGDAFVDSQLLPSENIERAFITLTAESRGAFPFRSENGSLNFPNDGIVREFHITGWEFLAARDTDTLRDWNITSVVTFLESIDFVPYVEHWFAEKANCKEIGDKHGYEFAKLMQNSLYGKFGANPSKYEEYMTCDPSHVDALNQMHGWDLADTIGSLAIVSRPLRDEAQRYYNVATAASITGFVRAYLWRSACKCGGLIYADTDSLFAADVSKLPIGDKLGEWSAEKNCDYGGFAGKKLYAAHGLDDTWKTASKGVKLDENQIIEIANGGEVTYARDVPTFSIKGGIKFVARKVRMT